MKKDVNHDLSDELDNLKLMIQYQPTTPRKREEALNRVKEINNILNPKK